MGDRFDIAGYDLVGLLELREADRAADRVAALDALRGTIWVVALDAAIRRARDGAPPLNQLGELYHWLEEDDGTVRPRWCDKSGNVL